MNTPGMKARQLEKTAEKNIKIELNFLSKTIKLGINSDSSNIYSQPYKTSTSNKKIRLTLIAGLLQLFLSLVWNEDLNFFI